MVKLKSMMFVALTFEKRKREVKYLEKGARSRVERTCLFSYTLVHQ